VASAKRAAPNLGVAGLVLAVAAVWQIAASFLSNYDLQCDLKDIASTTLPLSGIALRRHEPKCLMLVSPDIDS
jgi:hypothetical protein